MRFVDRAWVVVAGIVLFASCAPEPGSTATERDVSAPDRSAVSVPSPPTTPMAVPVTAEEPAGHLVYVAADASGAGTGAADAPFSTLAAGLESLEAGDTLIVAGGTYRERIDLRAPARGRPDAPIVVRAAPGERPVVRGLLWLHDLEHWVIDSINVTWDAAVNRSDEHLVKLDGGVGWTYRDSEVWGAQSYAGVLVVGAPVDFRVSGLYVHDTVPTNDKNQDHLIYLNAGTGGGIVERNLLVGSPNGRAIKVGPPEAGGPAVANVIIRHNTMVDNLGPSNVQLAWEVYDVLVERNVMVGALDRRANVTTFELSGSGNVIADNVGWGSVGVLEPEAGMDDGGGNLWVDPGLSGIDFRPTAEVALDYGHHAS